MSSSSLLHSTHYPNSGNTGSANTAQHTKRCQQELQFSTGLEGNSENLESKPSQWGVKIKWDLKTPNINSDFTFYAIPIKLPEFLPIGFFTSINAHFNLALPCVKLSSSVQVWRAPAIDPARLKTSNGALSAIA